VRWGEARPAVDLDEEVGEVDDRERVGDLAGELVDVGLVRLRAQALDAEVAALADRDIRVAALRVAIECVGWRAIRASWSRRRGSAVAGSSSRAARVVAPRTSRGAR
jgi:hypothetical protein